MLSRRQSFWRDCKDDTTNTEKHLGEIPGCFFLAAFYHVRNAVWTQFPAEIRVVRYLVFDNGTYALVFGDTAFAANGKAKADDDVIDAV